MMQNFKVRWTARNGNKVTSVVAYDRPSAEKRQELLKATGFEDVEIIEVKPGE
jgi:hypothetical protein